MLVIFTINSILKLKLFVIISVIIFSINCYFYLQVFSALLEKEKKKKNIEKNYYELVSFVIIMQSALNSSTAILNKSYSYHIICYINIKANIK
jgi:hypothetical protein